MATSREYLDEAVKRGFDAGRPNSGQEIAAYVADTLLKVPAETLREYRSYVEKQ